MERLKLFVVDDNEHFRSGIIFYLEQILKYKVIGEAYDGENFLKQKNIYVLADIILMDIQLPKMNGIQATKQLIWHHNNKNVIAVTDFQGIFGLTELITAGFKACVFKNRIYDDLPVAIDKVTKGRLHYPEEIV